MPNPILLCWRLQSGNLDVENSWFMLCEPNDQNQMVTRHSTVGNLVKPRFNRDIRNNFVTVGPCLFVYACVTVNNILAVIHSNLKFKSYSYGSDD